MTRNANMSWMIIGITSTAMLSAFGEKKTMKAYQQDHTTYLFTALTKKETPIMVILSGQANQKSKGDFIELITCYRTDCYCILLS